MSDDAGRAQRVATRLLSVDRLAAQNAPLGSDAVSAPLVSVVTPVYNTGAYIEDAIRSVLSQSYENWEYIICENHSTDDTALIAKRFADQDPRIRIVSPPEHLPQAQNFNHALQQISADSTYTKMILADDWMFPNCLTDMVAVAETSPTIGMVGAYRLEGTDGRNFGLPVEDTVVPGRVPVRMHFIDHNFVFGTQSSVMYRSDIVRERNPHFFDEDRHYFDTDAALQILEDRDFGFVHQILTFSRVQEDAITQREAGRFSREVDGMIAIHSYGHLYLDDAEYETSERWYHRRYYERVGREWLLGVFRKGPGDFWEFHEQWLASAGLTLDRRELMTGAARAVGRALLSPLEVLDRVKRARR